MGEGKRFAVTEEHLKLLRHLNIRWWEMEDGAPAVDPKRPYGSSNMYQSMLEVLGATPMVSVEVAGVTYIETGTSFEISEGARKRLKQLHEEMHEVLEILVQHGHLEPGVYRTPDPYSHQWSKEEA